MALIDKLTAIADAVREKSGGTNALTLEEIVTKIEGIEAGGGGDTTKEDGLVTRTLTEYSNSRVTEVGDYAFYYNTTLKSISLPNTTKIKSNAFNGCTALETIDFPNFIYMSGGNNFKGCSALKQVILPSYGIDTKTPMGIPSFNSCTALELLDVKNPLNIPNGSLGGCKNLKTLILRREINPTSLVNVGAFTNTPFASGGTGGTVYVPASLIESYKTATNWSTLYTVGTCNFVAIEGSEYE